MGPPFLEENEIAQQVEQVRPVAKPILGTDFTFVTPVTLATFTLRPVCCVISISSVLFLSRSARGQIAWVSGAHAFRCRDVAIQQQGEHDARDNSHAKDQAAIDRSRRLKAKQPEHHVESHAAHPVSDSAANEKRSVKVETKAQRGLVRAPFRTAKIKFAAANDEDTCCVPSGRTVVTDTVAASSREPSVSGVMRKTGDTPSSKMETANAPDGAKIFCTSSS
jgi:hypothetical protein